MLPNTTKTKEVSTHGFIPDLIMEEESEDGNDMKFNLDLDHLTRDAMRSIFGYGSTQPHVSVQGPACHNEEEGEYWDEGLEMDFDLDLDHLFLEALRELFLLKPKKPFLTMPKKSNVDKERFKMEFPLDLDHLVRDALNEILHIQPFEDDECTPTRVDEEGANWDEGLNMEFDLDLNHLFRDAIVSTWLTIKQRIQDEVNRFRPVLKVRPTSFRGTITTPQHPHDCNHRSKRALA